jgi:hypothetical protein
MNVHHEFRVPMTIGHRIWRDTVRRAGNQPYENFALWESSLPANSRLCAYSDDQLAEVASLQHADKGFGCVL